MVFWGIVIAVLVVVLTAAWWSDRRHRSTTNRFGKRKQLHADDQVNAARLEGRINDIGRNGGGSY